MCVSADMFRCGICAALIIFLSSYVWFDEPIETVTQRTPRTTLLTTTTETDTTSTTSTTTETTTETTTTPTTTTTTTRTTTETTTTIPPTTKTTRTTILTTTREPNECDLHMKNRGTGVYLGMVFTNYGSQNKKNPFSLKDVPFCICTHLMYAFHKTNTDGIVQKIHDTDKKGIKKIYKFIELRNKYPDIKLLFSVYYTNEIAVVFNSSTLRQALIADVVSILEEYELDGIDMSIGVATGLSQDHYLHYMNELRAALDRTKRKYLITCWAKVISEVTAHPNGYVWTLNKNVDFFRLQAAKYTFDDVAGVRAIYYNNLEYSVELLLKEWMDRGADPKKILSSLPTLAGSYWLQDSSKNTPESPHKNNGPPGHQAGMTKRWTFLEVCEELRFNWKYWTVVEVVNNYVYAYKGDHWMAYETTRIAHAKGRYAAKTGLAGFYFFGYENEDFKGLCQIHFCKLCFTYKYPLLHATVRGFNSYLDDDVRTKL